VVNDGMMATLMIGFTTVAMTFLGNPVGALGLTLQKNGLSMKPVEPSFLVAPPIVFWKSHGLYSFHWESSAGLNHFMLDMSPVTKIMVNPRCKPGFMVNHVY
jgi:hypothetical protein